MMNRLNGKILNELWRIGAKHALYREDGKWYHKLKKFPGALFDANGYIIFNSRKDYEECDYLQLKKDLHVPTGITSIPGYVRVTERNRFQDFSHQIREVSQKSYGAINKSNIITTLSTPQAIDFLDLINLKGY